VAATEPPHARGWVRKRMLADARRDIGNGEIGGNNQGSWIVHTIRAHDGTRQPTDTGGAWCASWVSAKLWGAYLAAKAELDLPEFSLGLKTSRGAVRLWKRVGKAGLFVPVDEARPGDIFGMRRKGGGHTGIVVAPLGQDGMLPTIEANLGRYPSVVKYNFRDPREVFDKVARYE
jgi:hypothetical protein